MYALFKDDRIISKPHSTQDACTVEAYEQGMMVRLVSVTEAVLAPGISIRNLDPEGKP